MISFGLFGIGCSIKYKKAEVCVKNLILTLEMYNYLSQCSIAVKRRYNHGNSYKGEHLIGAGLRFIGLLHCCHGGKHYDMWAVMAQDEEL